MEHDVILAKLESLNRCVNRLKEKRPPALADLQNDADRQDIIAINLERAVQMCVDIGAHLISDAQERAPNTMADTFETLCRMKVLNEACAERLKRAVGFRNLAVHQYQAINWTRVHEIVWNGLDVFSEFARAVLEALKPK